MAEKTQASETPKTLSVRGQTLQGKVVRDKMTKTVIIERELLKYVPKYKRYMKVTTTLAAHNPTEMNAKVGDVVEVGETRKISKTKSFTVTKILTKAK